MLTFGDGCEHCSGFRHSSIRADTDLLHHIHPPPLSFTIHSQLPSVHLASCMLGRAPPSTAIFDDAISKYLLWTIIPLIKSHNTQPIPHLLTRMLCFISFRICIMRPSFVCFLDSDQVYVCLCLCFCFRFSRIAPLPQVVYVPPTAPCTRTISIYSYPLPQASSVLTLLLFSFHIPLFPLCAYYTYLSNTLAFTATWLSTTSL